MTIIQARWNFGRRFGSIAVSLALFLGVVCAFLPSLRNDFVNYDDNFYVTANPHVQAGLTVSSVVWAFSNLHGEQTYWHPLTWVSHMLDCQLFGLAPWGHHLASVLWHALNTVLVFLVFRRMTGAFWRCTILAALFALHPLQVDTVAWVTERKNLLSSFFWLLTIWAYAGYAQKSAASNRCSVTRAQASDSSANDQRAGATDYRPRRYRLLFYVLALCFFALGLMSKPMLVTLPLVLLLLDYWPLHRLEATTPHSRSRTFVLLVGEKLPFFVLAAAASAITLAAHRALGMLAADPALPLDLRVGNALVSYCRYVGKVFYPLDLCVLYPYPQRWGVEKVLLSGLLVLAVSVLAATQRKQRPYLLVGWLWFLGTLVPVIGLVQVGLQAMADRFMYVPLLGLLLLSIWGLHDLARRWSGNRAALTAAGGAGLLACMALTRYQISYWKNGESLFRHAVEVTQSNCLAHNNLGYALTEQGRFSEAIPEFEAALKLNPRYAEARNNLGASLATQGNLDEAIRQFELIVKQAPGYAHAHYNLGAALADRGRYPEAVAQFREALRLQPEHPNAQQKLERSMAAQQKLQQDAEPYRAALRANPGDAGAHASLGRVLLEGGQVAEAMEQCAEAARLAPRSAEAQYQFGAALARSGQGEKAARQFEVTLELDPKLAAAHYALGIIRQQQRRMPEALKHWRDAARLAPQWADPLNNVAWALATDVQAEWRDGNEAVNLATRAVELAGTNSIRMLDTLAAAYAEAGRFAEASAMARQAQVAAGAQGEVDLAEQIGQRRVRYDLKQPYRQKRGPR